MSAIIINKFSQLIVANLLVLISFSAISVDIVRWNHGKDINEQRRSYKEMVLTRALELTKPMYGEYQFFESSKHLVIKRAMHEVISGEKINIFMAITSNKWEENTLPIRIPIRRGLLNYRLLATTDDKLSTFADLNYQSIKNKKAGLRRDWATLDSFKKLEFNYLTATALTGLYKMLSFGRVDYIPRGINDIFGEISKLSIEHKNLAVEPLSILYLQAPYYIFVSPKAPRLAKRLEAGLEMMVKDQSLKGLFYQYYKTSIDKARISERKVIHLNNPNLPPKTPLKRKELWFEYDK